MNKRGASIVVFIFEVLIVVGVIAASMGAANRMADSESTKQTQLITNVKMMVDTLISVPGDVVIEIPINMTKYELTIREDLIELNNEKREITAGYILPARMTAAGSEKNVEKVCLTKKKNFISLSQC
jgi:hypothetical protein